MSLGELAEGDLLGRASDWIASSSRALSRNASRYSRSMTDSELPGGGVRHPEIALALHGALAAGLVATHLRAAIALTGREKSQTEYSGHTRAWSQFPQTPR